MSSSSTQFDSGEIYKCSPKTRTQARVHTNLNSFSIGRGGKETWKEYFLYALPDRGEFTIFAQWMQSPRLIMMDMERALITGSRRNKQYSTAAALSLFSFLLSLVHLREFHAWACNLFRLQQRKSPAVKDQFRFPQDASSSSVSVS